MEPVRCREEGNREIMLGHFNGICKAHATCRINHMNECAAHFNHLQKRKTWKELLIQTLLSKFQHCLVYFLTHFPF